MTGPEALGGNSSWFDPARLWRSDQPKPKEIPGDLLDVHGDLRVFWREGEPAFSAGPGVDPVEDVERTLRWLDSRCERLRAWLSDWNARHHRGGQD